MKNKQHKNKIVFKKVTNTFGIGFNKANTFFEKLGINRKNNPLFIKKKSLMI